MQLRVFVFGAGSFVYACSTFSSDDQSAPPDAGAAIDAGAAADATEDGGSDAGAQVAPRGCASRDAAFCEDFDQGQFPWAFNAVDISDAGPVSLDATTQQWWSPPKSLHVTSEGSAFGVISWSTPSASPRIVGECRVHVVGVAPSVRAGLIGIAADNHHGVSFGYELGKPAMFVNDDNPAVDGGTKTTTTTFETPPIGDWSRIEIEWDLGQGTAKLRVDGNAAAEAGAPKLAAPVLAFSVGTVTFASAGGDAVDVDLDDCAALWK